MINGIKELRRLLGGAQKNTTGTVVSCKGNSVMVATGTGMRAVSSSMKVAEGDAVLVTGNTVVGKVKRQEELNHYYT